MPEEKWLRLRLPFGADLVTDQNLTGIRCVSSFELPPSSVERWRGRFWRLCFDVVVNFVSTFGNSRASRDPGGQSRLGTSIRIVLRSPSEQQQNLPVRGPFTSFSPIASLGTSGLHVLIIGRSAWEYHY